MITKSHYHFLLNLSPWPLISSINSFNLLFSFLIFLKLGFLDCFIFNMFNISFVSFFWWMTYSGEFNLEGSSSLNLEMGLKFSMLLFISSEIFFFFSFFWSYFHFYLSPSMEVGLVWPPFSLTAFNCFDVPLINTLILISSGVTVTLSHLHLNKGKKVVSMQYLFLTILLGITFTIFQLMEYHSSFFSISDSNFGTSFFVLTGFHGIHVIVGSIFLFIIFKRSVNLIYSKMNCLSFELSTWYWHFVDVIWIFLYFLLYYMNN